MIIEELIRTLRQRRNEARTPIIELVHDLEQYSLGTEVEIVGDIDKVLLGKYKSAKLDGEVLVIKT